MSLSGWEALADVQRGHNTRCGRVSLAELRTWNSKIVWLGGSRRRPTVVSELPCRTGKPRRAWTWKDKIVWPGVLSPASVGRSGLAESDGLDRRAKFRGLEGLTVNRQRGWVGPASRRMEKESCLSRRLSPTSDWFRNHRVGRVSLVEQ